MTTTAITNEEKQRRTEVRKLVGNVEQILGSFVDDHSYSHAFGMLIYLCLWIGFVFPVYLALLFVYFPVFYIVEQCGCVKHKGIFMKFIVYVPTMTLTEFVQSISFPIRTLTMLFNLGPLTKEAGVLMPNRATSVYVIPKSKLYEWQNFPKWEDVKNQLEVKPIQDIFMRGFSQGEVLFVSHKWFSGGKPDNERNDIFQLVKDHNLSNLEYIWFDYTCIPQAPESTEARNQQLFAIADLMKHCDVIPFHLNSSHEQAYQKSIWCRLEMMASSNYSPLTVSLDKMTIFDPQDLYRVLPAFIEMVCSRRYRYQFIGDEARLKIFVSILRFFMAYHDGVVVAGHV
jgi:hypothetical protein